MTAIDPLRTLGESAFGPPRVVVPSPTRIAGGFGRGSAMTKGDDEIRQQLSAHGDDGRTPRHALFYFYDGDLELMEELGRRNGFDVRQMVESRGVILEKTISVDALSFAPLATTMQQWALASGADYDGWECELVAGQ